MVTGQRSAVRNTFTMSRAGRVRDSTFISSILIYVYAFFTIVASSDYGVPIEIKLWDTGRTPIAHMVDVTNEFSLKVLAEHNFLNDNNIAFSPYGLMGILVALYEGVDGDSSYQLQRGIQLPWNRNTMRIGFRDIHRTLKTYFVPEEGFLAGLALNNENVTFNESYKRVLRFYGFDLENDQLPTFPPQSNITTTEITTVKSSTVNDETSAITDKENTSSTFIMTTETHEDTTLTTAKQDSTTSSNAETLANVDIREPTTSTTSSPSSSVKVETTFQSTAIISTTEQGTTKQLTDTETITQPTVTSTRTPSPTEAPISAPTTENIITSTSMATSNSEIDTETISQQTSQATVALTTGTITNEVNNPTTADLVSSTEQTISTASTTVASTTTNTENSQTETVITPSLENQETEQTATTSTSMSTLDSTTSVINNSTLKTLERRKKSIVDFIFTNPPYIDDHLLYRSFDIPQTVLEPNFENKLFMANGLKRIQVTYMHYDTVLEHAYLPHLEASALRLPLDSERYYLLVVLPARGGAAELERLLARMARESDLSDIYAALRPRRVKGIVPSFIVKGHVTLTTDLQKLGIRDVFEPRQRDFSPMTKQSGVYVRSIEQAVSVAIRKYRPDDHKKNRYVTNRKPVKFSATYPFLYFVMDASINVSLMAGKMVDPLNSRIL